MTAAKVLKKALEIDKYKQRICELQLSLAAKTREFDLLQECYNDLAKQAQSESGWDFKAMQDKYRKWMEYNQGCQRMTYNEKVQAEQMYQWALRKMKQANKELEALKAKQ